MGSTGRPLRAPPPCDSLENKRASRTNARTHARTHTRTSPRARAAALPRCGAPVAGRACALWRASVLRARARARMRVSFQHALWRVRGAGWGGGGGGLPGLLPLTPSQCKAFRHSL